MGWRIRSRRSNSQSEARGRPKAWTAADIVGSLPVELRFAVGLFLILAVAYSVVNPLFEAPDEVWHFRYVTHLAEGHGLPVLDPAHPGPWRQEGTQPPLYYALAALVVAPIDTRDAAVITRRNPHAAVGHPGADGNFNFVVHTPRERFPWRGAVLAAHLARFVSVLLGALTVTLTYLLALEVLTSTTNDQRPTINDRSCAVSAPASRSGRSLTEPALRGTVRGPATVGFRWAFFNHRVSPVSDQKGAAIRHRQSAVALTAALLVALNPQFLFLSGAINNDNLAATLAALTLLLLMRLVNRGPTLGRLIALGVVLGLAALSKLSGLGLWGLAALVLVGVAWRQRGWKAGLRWGILVFGIAAGLSGWWYLRNWLLYGDPTAFNVHLAVTGRRSGPVVPWQLLREFEGLRWSYWSVFGWFNVLPPGWVLRLFDLLSLMAIAGLLVALLRATPALRIRLLVLLLWVGIMLASLARWTVLTAATQGRLLFPALPATGVLLAVGLTVWIPRRYTRGVVSGLGVLLTGVALFCLFGVIRPAYARPTPLAPAQLAALPNRLDNAVFGERVALLGYDVRPTVLRPGDEFTVTLYWQGVAPMSTDYSIFIHLVGEGEIILTQRDSYPGRGNAPTSTWTPGVVFRDTYRLRLPPTASAPQSAWVAVGVYNLEGGYRLPLPDGTDRLALKAVRLVPIQADTAIPNPLRIDLGGKVRLAGYELATRVVRPGDTLELVLYWQALAPMDRNYTVFTQLLDDALRIWAQDDHQPLRGAYPTSRWAPGDVIRDVYRLKVRADAPPGVYRLEVGMYFLPTGERLYRSDVPTANSIRVAEVRVEDR